MKALLVVDLQNDFMPGGALGVARGDEVIPVANRLSRRFELVLATQDWHPRDHKSFATNHPGRAPGDVIELGGLEQVLWPVHCVQQTEGARFAPGLELVHLARVFRKGTDSDLDSYSAFFDNAHRRATGLGEYLQARAVKELYVLGLATDYCVRYTVLDALQLGLQPRIVEDGCRPVDLAPGDGERALRELERSGALRVTSADVEAERV